MDSSLHGIEDRSRPFELAPGKSENFRLGPGEAVDSARVIDEPGWSLYCLDFSRRNAVFVQLAPQADLADAPFMSLKQFKEASRVALVPFAALDGLSRRVPQPERRIFIFNIGRCGTTLANGMLNKVSGVWSLSEPDAFFDIDMKRREIDAPETRALIAATTRLLFRPPASRPAHTLAIKLRSQNAFQMHAYHAAFPDAKNVFLYRDGESWANSFFKFVQNVFSSAVLDVEARKFNWFMISADTDPAYLRPYMDLEAAEFHVEQEFAVAWALYLEAYEQARAGGMPFLALRYNELDGDRAASAARLLRHCGLPVGAAGAALEAFDEDSQAGTSIDRSHAALNFTPAQRARFRATLGRHPTIKSPDLRLEDMYGGQSAPPGDAVGP